MPNKLAAYYNLSTHAGLWLSEVKCPVCHCLGNSARSLTPRRKRYVKSNNITLHREKMLRQEQHDSMSKSITLHHEQCYITSNNITVRLKQHYFFVRNSITLCYIRIKTSRYIRNITLRQKQRCYALKKTRHIHSFTFQPNISIAGTPPKSEECCSFSHSLLKSCA